MNELGKIKYDINDRISPNPPLVVTDDGITGTSAFLYVLEDYGMTQEITAQDQLWAVRLLSPWLERTACQIVQRIVNTGSIINSYISFDPKLIINLTIKK